MLWNAESVEKMEPAITNVLRDWHQITWTEQNTTKFFFPVKKKRWPNLSFTHSIKSVFTQAQWTSNISVSYIQYTSHMYAICVYSYHCTPYIRWVRNLRNAVIFGMWILSWRHIKLIGSKSQFWYSILVYNSNLLYCTFFLRYIRKWNKSCNGFGLVSGL
jgi:hypothetical protein